MTMEVSSVIGWLDNQGRLDAAKNFKSKFGSMERVERDNIESFLVSHYGEQANEVFFDLRCSVLTFLDLATQN